MPLYEFQCEKCGHIFEELHERCEGQQKYSICPKCKELSKKIMSAGSFVVNGHNAANGYSKK